jgi:hypothetical protein
MTITVQPKTKANNQPHFSLHTQLAPGPSTTHIIANTGTSGHFFQQNTPLRNIQLAVHPIPVTLPNGNIIYSTHTGELPLDNLPIKVRQAHLFLTNLHSSLVSIGMLCDAGCIATFSAANVTITMNGTIILEGTRTPASRLWQLDLEHPLLPPVPATPPEQPPTGPSLLMATDAPSRNLPHAANAAFSATPAELVAYAHTTLFSPALSTLTAAADNEQLTSFVGLTSALIRKYPPQSFPMVKGHLDQTQKNQRSTKPVAPDTASPQPTVPAKASANNDLANFNPSDSLSERTNYCYTATMPTSGQVFSDQTGRFLAPSSTGNNYLLILYDFDSNSIHAEPMKTRTAAEHLAAYTRVHATLVKAGLQPKLQ